MWPNTFIWWATPDSSKKSVHENLAHAQRLYFPSFCLDLVVTTRKFADHAGTF